MWNLCCKCFNLALLLLLIQLDFCDATKVLVEDYNFDNLSGLKFTANQTNITISDSKYYNEDRNFIYLDDNNLVQIEGVANGATIGSNVNDLMFSMWVYLYRTDISFTFFCITTSSEINPSSTMNLCVTYDQPSGSIYMTYQNENGSFGDVCTGYTPYLGWQFIAFRYYGYSTFQDANDVFIFDWYDQAGAFNSISNCITKSSHDGYSSLNSTLGVLINDGDEINKLEGLISQFQVYQLGGAFSDIYSNYTNELIQRRDLFDYYWDLTDNSKYTYNSVPTQSCSYCSNNITKFVYSDSAKPMPVVLNIGWSSTNNSTVIMTDSIQFNGLNHWTIEAEIYIYYPWFDIDFRINEAGAGADQNHVIKLTHWGRNLQDPWRTFNVNFNKYKWNRVYITMSPKSSSEHEMCMIVQTLSRDDQTEIAPSSSCADINNSKVFDSDSFQVLISGEGLVLQNLKVYRYKMALDTISLDKYQDVSPYDKHTFGENFKSNYYDKLTNWQFYVADENNPCIQYIIPPDACTSLEVSQSDCPDGYEFERAFCKEKCGDGVLKNFNQSGQMLGCDDGNSVNGDGCSNSCSVESGYICNVLQNNRSFCYLSCGDGEKTADEDCDDGNYSDNDGCSSDCLIEANYSCSQVDGETSVCGPTCGSGRLDAGETCDDNNDMNYDGCDSNCQIEDGYSCVENTTLGYYVCTPINDPPVVTFKSLKVNEETILFEFSDQMIQVENLDDYMACSNKDITSEYSVSCKFKYISSTQIQVDYTINPDLVDFVEIVMQVSFNDINGFQSINDIYMESTASFDTRISKSTPNENIESAAAGMSFGFLVSWGVSIAAGLLAGGSLELMWSMTNTLQIVFYFGLLDLYFPANTYVIFKYMNYANFDNPIVTLVSKYIFSGEYFDTDPINSRFYDLGLESRNFISNGSDTLPVIILLILFSIFLILLRLAINPCDNKLVNSIKNFETGYNFNSLIRSCIELCLYLFIISMIGLSKYNSSVIYDRVSVFISVLALSILVFVIVYVILCIIIYRENLHNEYKKHLRYKIIFEEFKVKEVYYLIFYPLFMIRRLLLGFTFVFVRYHPRTQCLVIVYTSFVVSYHLKCRPFKDTVLNILTLVNELFLLAMSCVLFLFLDEKQPKRLNQGMYIMNTLIALFFVFNWSIIFPIKIKEICQSVRKKCSKCSKKDNQKEYEENKINNNHSEVVIATEEYKMQGSITKLTARDIKKNRGEYEFKLNR